MTPSVAFATYEGSPRATDDDQLVVVELERRGVTVVSAVWDAQDVDWSRFDCVVIRSTWDYHLKRSAYEKWIRGFAGQDILLQPYMPEVAVKGEWSLIFFDGEHSHSVLKKPAPGDFRVQRHHGGHATAAEPDPRLVDQAQAILPVIGHALLYARLDGVERDGRFVLMEAEINEPYLFIATSEGAARRFAEAIIRVLPSGAREAVEPGERLY